MVADPEPASEPEPVENNSQAMVVLQLMVQWRNVQYQARRPKACGTCPFGRRREQGIFTAAVRAGIEQQHQDGAPMADYCNLVVGTSAGGIIALGLAVGVPAAGLLSLRNRGREIFPPRFRTLLKYASVATPPIIGNLWTRSRLVFGTTADSGMRAVAGAYPRWTGAMALFMFSKNTASHGLPERR